MNRKIIGERNVYMNKKKLKIVVVISYIMVTFFSLTGCSNPFTTSESPQIVLTTGFKSDEIFRIENISCSQSEIMIYLTNTQNQYSSVFGSEIWEADMEGANLKENIKQTVIARIAQVKAMNLLAKEHGVSLDNEENKLALVAAKQYFDSLSQTEINAMGVTIEILETMYIEYATANKLYQDIIKDINPEISDDEARTITVSHILLKTYTLNGLDEKIEYSSERKAEVYAKMEDILLEAKNGADFDELIRKYSEDSTAIYSFGKGESDPAFEAAAFELGTNEMSGIVETESGYHIIKCLNTFNQEETDINKIAIVEKRKKEVFQEEYNAFVSTLTKNINEELWNSIELIEDEKVTTNSFFHTYHTVFTVES